MSLPNGNGFGDDQNGYPAGYGPNNMRQNFHGNTVEHYSQQDLHYPYAYSNDSNIPNPTFQNQYQGQQLQQSYNYGSNNYAPQFINQPSQYYTREQHRQQQPIPHRNVLANSPPITVSEVSSVPHQSFNQQYHRLPSRRSSITNSQPDPPIYHPNSAVENHQYQTSPQNFQVPSITTTQNSNESFLFEGNTLTDISSFQNPCQNSAVPVTHPINKSLKDINMDEMVQILDESGWNPDLTIDSPLVYETFEISSIADEQNFIEHQLNVNVNDNVATFYPQNAFQPQQNSPTAYFPLFPQENRILANVQDNNASEAQPPSSSIGKRPVGRPLTYANDKQRKEAHRIASRTSYGKCKNKKDEERQNLIATIQAEEVEKSNLLKQLSKLKKVCDQTLKANSKLFSEEQKNWAEQILNQHSDS